VPDNVEAWAVEMLATAAKNQAEQGRAKVLKVLEQEHRLRLAAAQQLADRSQPRVDVAIERRATRSSRSCWRSSSSRSGTSS
jgi:hypothetical protein